MKRTLYFNGYVICTMDILTDKIIFNNVGHENRSFMMLFINKIFHRNDFMDKYEYDDEEKCFIYPINNVDYFLIMGYFFHNNLTNVNMFTVH